MADGYQCSSEARTCWATEMMEHFAVGPKSTAGGSKLRQDVSFFILLVCLGFFAALAAILTRN